MLTVLEHPRCNRVPTSPQFLPVESSLLLVMSETVHFKASYCEIRRSALNRDPERSACPKVQLKRQLGDAPGRGDIRLPTDLGGTQIDQEAGSRGARTRLRCDP